jgi:hypothetical protein
LSGKDGILSGNVKVKLRTLPTQVSGMPARRFAMHACPDGLAPSEQQVTAEFEVSRAVAHEALKARTGAVSRSIATMSCSAIVGRHRQTGGIPESGHGDDLGGPEGGSMTKTR